MRFHTPLLLAFLSLSSLVRPVFAEGAPEHEVARSLAFQIQKVTGEKLPSRALTLELARAGFHAGTAPRLIELERYPTLGGKTLFLVSGRSFPLEQPSPAEASLLGFQTIRPKDSAPRAMAHFRARGDVPEDFFDSFQNPGNPPEKGTQYLGDIFFEGGEISFRDQAGEPTEAEFTLAGSPPRSYRIRKLAFFFCVEVREAGEPLAYAVFFREPV